jgi:hypothetical protein
LLSAPPSVQFAGGGMVVIFAVVRFSGEVCGASDPFSIWFCSNCFDCLCSQLVWWWLRFDFVVVPHHRFLWNMLLFFYGGVGVSTPPVVLVFSGSRVVFCLHARFCSMYEWWFGVVLVLRW